MLRDHCTTLRSLRQFHDGDGDGNRDGDGDGDGKADGDTFVANGIYRTLPRCTERCHSSST